jgi:MinD superfamily P-loop ATPase
MLADYLGRPPGIGCPVIFSLRPAGFACYRTTLSGMHDLERVVSVCRHFEVPAVVCINKYDVNEDNSRKIEELCRRENVQLIARLPYSDAVTRAMIAGMPVVEYDGKFGEIVKQLWSRLSAKLSPM